MKKLLEKLSRSRDLTLSVMVHFVIVLILAATVVVKVATEPPEPISGTLLEPDHSPVQPPEVVPETPQFTHDSTSQTPSSQTEAILDMIRSVGEGPKTFEPLMPTLGKSQGVPEVDSKMANPVPSPNKIEGIPKAARGAIADMVGSWKRPNDIYDFTAVLAQYDGGDWNSTVRVKDQKVVGGSLPNLLYLMNIWSKDRIRTNEDKVQVMRLDSAEILTARPPFVFMTGTRDFKLTDAEVENLRKYLMMGGCVWGDSSVPGERSRFDAAFRREMKRVIGNVDAEFEALPNKHRLFQEGYFKQVTSVPPGLNFYTEPVSVLKIYGEVAVIYTSNDYADMWQIGLDSKGEVDLRRNEFGVHVAINPHLWQYRETYLANLSPVAKGKDPAANLAETYRFGTNVIFHLLTRWDEKLGATSPL